MYTKCPDCNAVFRVTTEQLEIVEGLVRCGLCDAVFNGKDHIHEDPDLPATTSTDSIKQEHKSADTESSVTVTTADETTQHDEDELIDTDKIPTVIRDDFGTGFFSRPGNPLHVALWTAGALLLATFFLGQITYWQSVDVLPRTWVDGFCKFIRCTSSVERDLTAIKILNRNIYTHPNVENALMITTSFVNESEIAQPFPLLQVALLDTQGQIVAIRRFNPGDYLVNKNLVPELMQPDQPIGARLEVFDPGSKVIAYEFDFY